MKQQFIHFSKALEVLNVSRKTLLSWIKKEIIAHIRFSNMQDVFF